MSFAPYSFLNCSSLTKVSSSTNHPFPPWQWRLHCQSWRPVGHRSDNRKTRFQRRTRCLPALRLRGSLLGLWIPSERSLFYYLLAYTISSFSPWTLPVLFTNLHRFHSLKDYNTPNGAKQTNEEPTPFWTKSTPWSSILCLPSLQGTKTCPHPLVLREDENFTEALSVHWIAPQPLAALPAPRPVLFHLSFCIAAAVSFLKHKSVYIIFLHSLPIVFQTPSYGVYKLTYLVS